MLSVSLASSYKKYKADTTAFTAWLLRTAVKCGWKPYRPSYLPPSSTPKKANGEKYKITTSDLKIQAETIAASTHPRIQIPTSVIDVVNRCISARERCAAWYSDAGTDADFVDDDGGHAHFIEVLKDIVHTLRPCIVKKVVKKEVTPSSNSSTDNGHKQTQPTHQNKFSALEVEEAEEFLRDEPVMRSKAEKKNEKVIVETNVAVYNSLSTQRSEAIFDVYCFFEDLHVMENHLKQVWRRYKDQKIDLLTATAVTNAAIELVRRAENDLLDALPSGLVKDRSFGSLLSATSSRDILNNGAKVDLKASYAARCSMASLDDFLYLSTARTLLRWLNTKQGLRSHARSSADIKDDAVEGRTLSTSDESDAAYENNELLTILLSDVRQLAERKFVGDFPGVRHDFIHNDMFSHAGIQLWRTKCLGAWMVFASQIIIDINRTLDTQIKRPYQEMQIAAMKTIDLLQLHREMKIDESWEFNEMWSPASSGMIGQINYMAYVRCCLDDVLFNSRNVADGSAISANDSKKTPRCGRNSLYCGTTMMQLRIELETYSLAFTNHHRSILSMAHLYNAARQMQLLEHEWLDLEKYIDEQMPHLFGSQLPTTPQAMYSRLLIRMGSSTTNFAPVERARSGPNAGITARNAAQYHLQSTPVVSLFEQLFRNRLSWEQCLHRLNDLVEAQASQRQKPQHILRLQPMEYLPRLETLISQTSSKLKRLDYLTISRECNKCLRLIGVIINHTCDNPWPDIDHGFSNILIVCDILWDCAREEAETYGQEDYEPGTRTFASQARRVGGDGIQLAADVLNKSLARKKLQKAAK